MSDIASISSQAEELGLIDIVFLFTERISLCQTERGGGIKR